MLVTVLVDLDFVQSFMSYTLFTFLMTEYWSYTTMTQLSSPEPLWTWFEKRGKKSVGTYLVIKRIFAQQNVTIIFLVYHLLHLTIHFHRSFVHLHRSFVHLHRSLVYILPLFIHIPITASNAAPLAASSGINHGARRGDKRGATRSGGTASGGKPPWRRW